MIVNRVQVVVTIAARLIWTRLGGLGNEVSRESKGDINDVLNDTV